MRSEPGLESFKYANRANAGEYYRAHASGKRADARWFDGAGMQILAVMRRLGKKQFQRGELARLSRYATRLDSLTIRAIRVPELWVVLAPC